MNMVSMSISKEVERRRCLPLEIRSQIYNDVIELRKQGLKYKEIQREIYEKYRIQISRHTDFGLIRKSIHLGGLINSMGGFHLN